MARRTCPASPRLMPHRRIVIEHRHCRRIPGQLLIRLWRKDRWLGPFPTRDLSPDDFFLTTGYLKLCRRREWIHLMLEGAGACHSMAGLVARQSPEGIGVVLIKHDPRYTQALLEVSAAMAELPAWIDALSRAMAC
jgi:hypothetical protein